MKEPLTIKLTSLEANAVKFVIEKAFFNSLIPDKDKGPIEWFYNRLVGIMRGADIESLVSK